MPFCTPRRRRGGAFFAQRRAVRQANRRAEIHHRLVPFAGTLAVDAFGEHGAKRLRTLASIMSSAMPPTRAATRRRLPSTAGSGSPKAMEAMALAV